MWKTNGDCQINKRLPYFKEKSILSCRDNIKIKIINKYNPIIIKF